MEVKRKGAQRSLSVTYKFIHSLALAHTDRHSTIYISAAQAFYPRDAS